MHSCCFWKPYLVKVLNCLESGICELNIQICELPVDVKISYNCAVRQVCENADTAEFILSDKDIRSSVGGLFIFDSFALAFLTNTDWKVTQCGTFIFVQEREAAGKTSEWM